MVTETYTIKILWIVWYKQETLKMSVSNVAAKFPISHISNQSTN